MLAGISMGAATGVAVLFNLDVPPAAGGRLGGFLGFSCRCPFAGRDLDGMRRAVGLEERAWGRGEKTLRTRRCYWSTVRMTRSFWSGTGRRLRDTLKGFGVGTVEWREYPTGGHWFNSPRGMDDAVEFINRHVLRVAEDGGDPMDLE